MSDQRKVDGLGSCHLDLNAVLCVLDDLEDGVWVHDTDTLYCSRSAADILSVGDDGPLGHLARVPLVTLMSEHDAASWRSGVERLLASGEMLCVDVLANHPSGTQPLRLTGRRLSNGLCAGTIAHRGKRPHTDDANWFELAERYGQVGSWRWSVQDGTAWWSASMYDLYERDRSLGPITLEDWLDPVHPDDWASLQAAVEESMQTGDYRSEFRVKSRSLGWRWLRSVGAVEFGSDGTPRIHSGVTTDITEIRQIEQERLRVERQQAQNQKLEAIGLLAGGVAHDFNNVLTGIMTFSHMAREELETNEWGLECIDEVLAAAQRAARLTQQLLTFSRRKPRPPEIVDLNSVVGDMKHFVGRLLPENIVCETSFCPFQATVMSDRGQLEQILLNLCVNARDALPEGGSLSVSTTVRTLTLPFRGQPEDVPAGRYVVLTVRDNGTGIDQDDLPKIIEPFFTTKKHGEGTGLGLATVYGIVKQYQGAFQVDSRPGQGTEVRIYLPFAEGAPRGVQSTRPALAATANDGQVLLIEDDPHVRAALEAILRRSGYDVLSVPDAEKAKAVIGTGFMPDVVLSDISLPGCNGQTFGRWLYRLQPDARVVYITGYDSDQLDDLEPFESVVEKPLSASRLLSHLAQLPTRPARLPALRLSHH